MAARVTAPASMKTPEQIIDEHADVIATIAKKLVAQNAQLRANEIDLNTRLADALEEVQTLRRQNETMLAEFQTLQSRVGKQVSR